LLNEQLGHHKNGESGEEYDSCDGCYGSDDGHIIFLPDFNFNAAMDE